MKRYQISILHYSVLLATVALGPMLTFDPVGEKFTGDFSEEANRLVKPMYRKPFIITEKI